MKEVIVARGHLNIQAIHPTTLMFTKDKYLSKSGDCIAAVFADKSIDELNNEFKNKLKEENTKLTVLIEVEGLREQINAVGSQKLILSHPTDIVIRKSEYICKRTLAIRADKASNDLPRAFIEKLKNPKTKVTISLVAGS